MPLEEITDELPLEETTVELQPVDPPAKNSHMKQYDGSIGDSIFSPLV